MLSNLTRNKSVLWILIGGLIVQVITAITQLGFSSGDQHFQIVEFSMYQLGKPNGAVEVWEIDNFVRPTLQVYLFSGFHLACNFLHITDPYTQHTILRVILGIIMWAVFNLFTMHFLRNSGSIAMVSALLVLNFGWALPFSRTLFSSEMMSSLFLFGSIYLYDYFKNSKYFLIMVGMGFLFSLAFYLRFQTAFGMLGVLIWMLFVEKKYRHVVPLGIGFLLGVALNSWLDYMFYGQFVFTPYTYYYANIVDGRADLFGRSSFLRYIGLIIAIIPAPLFSIIVFFYLLKLPFKKLADPVVLAVFLFVIFHSLVGHKEERFMFPIFNALPLLIGYAVPWIVDTFNSGRKWVGISMSLLLGTTLFINTAFLSAMLVVPYSQTVAFSKKVSEHFKGREVAIFSLRQSPFETPSGHEMEYYKQAAQNISVRKIRNFRASYIERESPRYLAVSFNDVKDHFAELERMGYKPVFSSSELLWKLNLFLQSKKVNTINEIWRLYERER